MDVRCIRNTQRRRHMFSELLSFARYPMDSYISPSGQRMVTKRLEHAMNNLVAVGLCVKRIWNYVTTPTLLSVLRAGENVTSRETSGNTSIISVVRRISVDASTELTAPANWR